MHIYERDLGQEHPYRAIALGNLALLSTKQKKWSEAESFFQQALAIHKKTVGLKHFRVAQTLHDMALFYLEQDKYEQAACLHQQAMDIQEEVFGREHSLVVSMREYYQEYSSNISEKSDLFETYSTRTYPTSRSTLLNARTNLGYKAYQENEEQAAKREVGTHTRGTDYDTQNVTSVHSLLCIVGQSKSEFAR